MDKSRQQFEEWVEAHYGAKSEEYDEVIENVLWDVWQASRESLEVELPENKSDPHCDNFDLGVSLGIDQVKKVLIANGVKVK